MSSSGSKSALVTGASGYVASSLIPLLRERGYQVEGIDRVSADERIARLCASFSLIDITKPKRLGELARRSWDTVLHLAARCSVPESIEKERLYIETNATATESLLKTLDYGRFVFISSSAAKEPDSSPYALSKFNAEDFVRRHAPSRGNTIRLYNVIGDSGIKYSNSPDSLFARLIKAQSQGFIVNGSDYPGSPDGSCIRSIIHVHDVAKSLLNLLESPAEEIGAEPLELAYPDPITVIGLAKAFRQSNGLDFDIHLGDRRNGDIPYSRIETPPAPFLATEYADINQLTRIARSPKPRPQRATPLRQKPGALRVRR